MDKTINQNLIVKGSLTADSVITQKKDEPIGSIIMGTGDNFATQTAVQAIYNGTWEQIKDVFLLAAGDSYIAGSTGGEATHTLTVNEMPKHSHNLPVDKNYGEATTTERDRINLTSGIAYNNGYASNDTGANQPHNNMAYKMPTCYRSNKILC